MICWEVLSQAFVYVVQMRICLGKVQFHSCLCGWRAPRLAGWCPNLDNETFTSNNISKITLKNMLSKSREGSYLLASWRLEVVTFSQRGFFSFIHFRQRQHLWRVYLTPPSPKWITRVELTEQRINIQKVEVIVQTVSRSLERNQRPWLVSFLTSRPQNLGGFRFLKLGGLAKCIVLRDDGGKPAWPDCCIKQLHERWISGTHIPLP